MANKGAPRAETAAEQGLRETDHAALVGRGFGDFMFNTGFDMVSDRGKIRHAGFAETVDSGEAPVGRSAGCRDARCCRRVRREAGLRPDPPRASSFKHGSLWKPFASATDSKGSAVGG
jgi:hypothetical protein